MTSFHKPPFVIHWLKCDFDKKHACIFSLKLKTSYSEVAHEEMLFILSIVIKCQGENRYSACEICEKENAKVLPTLHAIP